MTRTLFRSRAMSRNAGPEKLDERIRVVTVSGWISLGIGVTVAVALLAWAGLGTTRSQVSGTALLVRAPYTFTAEAPVYGFLSQDPPPPGTQVVQGQQIAEIRETADPGSKPVPILAPVTGTVISTAAEKGTVVVQGQDVAYLEVETGPLVAQAFIPTTAGKRVVRGMTGEVEPSTAPSATYGRMLATVTYVSKYSLTPDRVRTVVGTSAIANQIINGPPVLLVTLTLTPASTPGRFRWTSGNGPSFEVGTGTLAEATITLSSSRPIDSVFGRANR